MMKNKVTDDWASIKIKLKERFSKLSDANIESLKGSMDMLSSKLQSVYGYAKEKADSEFKSFQESMQSMAEGGMSHKKNGTMPRQKPMESSKSHSNP